MAQRFNADTAALAQREILNQGAARFDLEAWIAGHVRPAAGQRILDLGCGRGKQVFALAPLVLPGGAVLGIDVSPEAIAEVQGRAAREGLRHVEAIECGLDDCLKRLAGRVFDRILSTYAVYYAHDMVGLMTGLRAQLAPGGAAFHCGFGRGSNQEIIEIIRRVAAGGEAAAPCARDGAAAVPAGGDEVRGAASIEDFISPDEIERLRATYAHVQVVRLENSVAFPTAEAVMRWWENHNSYRPELAEGVRSGVAAVVDRHGVFPLAKHVVGIVLHV